MIVITGTVSRKFFAVNSRFSAQSAMPIATATQLRISLSQAVFQKLSDGFEKRGISRPKQPMEASSKPLISISRMQKAATGKVTAF